MRTLSRALSVGRFLYLQRIKGFDPPSANPLMDPPTAERFVEELRRANCYVEYGSGGTTVVADRLGIPTWSVESDRYYARVVKSCLSPASAVNQIVVDLGFTHKWGTPLFSSPAKADRYVCAPHACPNRPDFILVDGRYRVACALAAANWANRLGCRPTLLIDDYTGRANYQIVERYLGPPELVGRSAVFKLGGEPIPEEAVHSAYADKL